MNDSKNISKETQDIIDEQSAGLPLPDYASEVIEQIRQDLAKQKNNEETKNSDVPKKNTLEDLLKGLYDLEDHITQIKDNQKNAWYMTNDVLQEYFGVSKVQVNPMYLFYGFEKANSFVGICHDYIAKAKEETRELTKKFDSLMEMAQTFESKDN